MSAPRDKLRSPFLRLKAEAGICDCDKSWDDLRVALVFSRVVVVEVPSSMSISDRVPRTDFERG